MMPLLNLDVLCEIAKQLDHPCDVLALSLTSRSVYSLLQQELYTSDIFDRQYDLTSRTGSLTALHHNVLTGKTDVVRRIIEIALAIFPGYVDLSHRVGKLTASALGHAIRLGYDNIVWHLINVRDSQSTLIQYNCDLKEPNTHGWLLARTINFLRYDTNQHEALVNLDIIGLALLYGRQDLALSFIEKQVFSFVKPISKCESMIFPTEMACILNSRQILASIYNNEALAASFHRYMTSNRLWLANVPLLSIAVTGSGETDILRYLVDQGEDVDLFCTAGRTALYWAVALEMLDKAMFLMEIPNTRAPFWSYEGDTIFILSVRSDSMLPVTEWLLKSGRIRPFELEEGLREAGIAGFAASKTYELLQGHMKNPSCGGP